MKTNLFFSFILLCFLCNAQGGSMFFSTDAPDRKFMPNMNSSYGGGFELLIPPKKKSPFQITFSYAGAYYAYKTLPTTYTSPEGDQTKTDVVYTSAMNKFLLGTRLLPKNHEQNILPYLAASGGVNVMRSMIAIEDPDEGGCEAIESKVVFTRAGFLYTAGAGVMINTGLFSGKEKPAKSFIDLSCHFTGGSRIEYINVNHMQDEPHTAATHSGTAATPDKRDYYARFVNVGTNSIHEHKIAEVYRSAINMWGVRIGYTILF